MIPSRLARLRRLVTVVVGASLAVVLAGCGSNTADIADDGTPSTSTDATSPSSTPPEPTEPTESPTTTSGDTIDGEGYTYAIPDGWEDVGDEATTAQADSAVRVTEPDGFGTNINVIVTPSAGTTDVESLRETFKKQIKGLVDTKVEEVDNITIDGESAIGQTASADEQGETLVFTQYFVAHDNNVYAVTLTAPEGNAEEGRAALDSVLTSWAWD